LRRIIENAQAGGNVEAKVIEIGVRRRYLPDLLRD